MFGELELLFVFGLLIGICFVIFIVWFLDTESKKYYGYDWKETNNKENRRLEAREINEKIKQEAQGKQEKQEKHKCDDKTYIYVDSFGQKITYNEKGEIL